MSTTDYNAIATARRLEMQSFFAANPGKKAVTAKELLAWQAEQAVKALAPAPAKKARKAKAAKADPEIARLEAIAAGLQDEQDYAW